MEIGSMKRLLGILWGYPALRFQRLHRQAVYYASLRELTRSFRKCGAHFAIAAPWDIRSPEHIEIGNDVFIGPDVLIIAGPGADVRIADKAMLGPKIRIVPGSHKIDDPAIPMTAGGPQRPIEVGESAWIATGAILVGGAKIGRGAVIAAGSVVTKPVPPYEVWGGNPARKIRDRFAKSAVAE